MFMTENDARKKWCPMARFWGANSEPNEPAFNRPAFGQVNCIGSDCMLWQWHKQVKCAPEAIMQAESIGCCGLVGR